MTVEPSPERAAGRAAPEPPSGRQLHLANGDQQAVVTEVGATLRSYTVGDEPILDGFAEDEICSVARGQLLIPWPNRLGDGRYSFGGTDHQVPLDEPELSNALHGLVRWDSWAAEPHSASRLTMRHRLHPRPGYPFCLELTADYQLERTGLTVSLAAINIGDAPAPFGAGSHPYLRVGTPFIDTCTLRIPASTALLTNSRFLPVGRAPVAGTDRDFREPRLIGDIRIDASYTGLARDPDGLARVTLQAPDGRRLTLWTDESFRWLQLFGGDPLPRGERRRGLAVEPMTCPPDAFRSGEDLIVLEPGETTGARWGIDVTGFRR